MEKNVNFESLLNMVKEDDLEFYENFLQDLTDEEFLNFIKENQDFLTDNSDK